MIESMDTDCEVILFVSNSGKCNIHCDYCIVGPLGRDEPSLDYDDLVYLAGFFNRRTFFVFSGKGDFFSSHPRSEMLLSRLLDHDVEIGLDINGSQIHEFPDLPPGKMERVRYINLTMHYHGMKQRNVLHDWARNAEVLIDRKGDVMLLGYIMSPSLISEWEEGLEFYQRTVFRKTGKKILLIRHVLQEFTEREEEHLQVLGSRYEHLVEGIFREDFAKRFEKHDEVLCPAGWTFFRIWNDGAIHGCPHIDELLHCGNVKRREFTVSDRPHRCSTPRFCDCHIVDGLGKMGFC